MNKRAVVILALIVIGLAALLFRDSRRSPDQKTLLRDSASTFVTAPLDQKSDAFFLRRETEWTRHEVAEAPWSVIMQAAGLAASVSNLTNVLASSTPRYRWSHPYAWLHPRRAAAANALANMKDDWLELIQEWESPDGPTLRISDDADVGLLWLSTDIVLVFEDATNGMREARYRRSAKEVPPPPPGAR